MLFRSYKNYGLSITDLVQEGHIGLMQAIAKFEPQRDIRFSTYAGWWIRSSIQDYVLKNWSIVRTGTTASQKSLFFSLRKLKLELMHYEKDQNKLRHMVAKKLKVKPSDVEKSMISGCSSVVEHHVANVRVVSSNLIARSIFLL